MFFSIITPVYNEKDTIRKSLDSVLGQTFSSYEHILVNDGSTDGCEKIIEEYMSKDPRIKLYQQENQGPIAARDKAIALAKGDFCVFLDADDSFEEDLLEKVHEAIVESNCDLCLYKWNFVEEGGRKEVRGVFDHKSLFTEDNMDLLYKKIVSQSELNSLWTKAIKREILQSIERDKDFLWIRRAEDLYTSLQIFTKAKRVIYLDLALYNYNTTLTTSMTKKYDKTLFKSSSTVRKEVLKYMSIWGIDDIDSLTSFYNWHLKNSLRLMKGAFMLGIKRREKYILLEEMLGDDFLIETLEKIDKSYFSRLDKIEISLLNRKRIHSLYILNTLIFNRFVAKPLIERAEKKLYVYKK